MRWFTASTTNGKRADQSLPLRVISRMPTGSAACHQPEAVVLDLVNPVGAGRGLVGGRWEARFDEARPVRGKPRTHTLDQHAPNLGGRGAESNQPLQ